MQSPDSLDRFEESVYQEYNCSGATEIWLALCFWLFALATVAWPGSLLGQIVVLALVGIPMYFVARSWRSRVIYPRLGYARIVDKPRQFRLSPTQRKYLLHWFALATLFTVIFRLAWRLPQHLNSARPTMVRNENPWTGLEDDGQFTLLIAFVLAWLRVLLRTRPWGTSSFWWITICAVVVVAVAGYFQVRPGWVLCSIGLPMMGIGLMRLRGFLRDHPPLGSADGQ
jgi:hypothetical protein